MIIEFDQEAYNRSLEKLATILSEAAKEHLDSKKLPTYDDFIDAPFPKLKRVYFKNICLHKETTTIIESDENGNKTHKTVCNNCGVAIFDNINKDSVI